MKILFKITLVLCLFFIGNKAVAQTTYTSTHEGAPADFTWYDGRSISGYCDVGLQGNSEVAVIYSSILVVGRSIEDDSVYDDLVYEERYSSSSILQAFNPVGYSSVDVYYYVEYSDQTYEYKTEHIVL